MDSLQFNPAMLSGVTLGSLPPTGAGPSITGAVTVPWGNPQTEIQKRMTGLTSHTAYVAEVSLDPTFPANETMTDTGWTIEPDLVRVGVRKVTETEAVVTGLMDVPNGQDYDLGCQSQLADVDGYWSPVTSGYVGSISMQPLTAQTDYEYRCRLQWDFGAFGPYGRMSGSKYTRMLGTVLALAEIRGQVSGSDVLIDVILANTDGAYHDVYLRYREYPQENWTDAPSMSANSTDSRFSISGLTADAVYKFEAALDLFFNQETTLTPFLVVGNPPYSTVGNSGGGTPPTPEPTPTPDPNTATAAARRTPTTAKSHLPRRQITAVSRQTRMPTTAMAVAVAARSRRITEAAEAEASAAAR